MLETNQGSPFDHPSKTFLEVRFVLHGFDPESKTKVLSKLVDGGGVNVGQYGPNCTHVIVDKLVYDDPICVAARSDGKILVTALWVAHSFDVGMPVDPSSMMYRPLKDLKGIPGAKSLIVCLTGYQRQDRDDIMTMVGLMGANFSKPLVANKVTHLICYKFEGEKYELAKKMKKIKLVNHRWLEDCLKAWEILPEADYDKSGFELEMMEAEAKDSEEEAGDSATKKYKGEVASPHQHQISKKEVSRNPLDSSASKGLSNVGNTIDMVSVTGKETIFDQAPNLHEIHKKHSEVLGSRDTVTLKDVTFGEPSKPFDRTETPARVANDLASTSRSAKRSPHSDAAKLGTPSYLRKSPRGTTSPMFSREMTSNLSSASMVNVGKFNVTDGFDISSSMIGQAKDGTDFSCVKTPSKGTELISEGEKSGTLPEKRKMDVSCGSSKLQKMSDNPKARIVVNRTELFAPISKRNGRVEINNPLSPGNDAHYSNEPAALNPEHNSPANISTREKSLASVVRISKTVTSEIRQDVNVEEALQTPLSALKKSRLDSKSDIRDVSMSRAEHAIGEVQEPENEMQDIEVSSRITKTIEKEKSSSSATLDLFKGGSADEQSKSRRRKTLGKKSLGSKQSLGKGNTTNQKGSIYLNKVASHNDDGRKETADQTFENSEKLEMVPPAVNVDSAMREERVDVPQSGNEVENKFVFMEDETESPEDKEENEFEAAVGDEKYGEVEPDNIGDKVTEEKSEGMQHITKKTDDSIVGMHDLEMASDDDTGGIEQQTAVCGKKTDLGDSNHIKNAVKEKTSKGTKRPSSKIRKKIVPSVTKITNSKEAANEEAKSERINERIHAETEKSIPHLAGKTKRTVSLHKLQKPVELEEENRPISSGDQNASHGNKRMGKVASNKTPKKIDKKAGESDRDSMLVDGVPKTDPVWFILSGHKLQRKEFQQFIRRLKGRVCRDSHQWSYQATHFIVPDPVRRTEKFFAAAASGRWILKTDYLTASNQAGRFLAEEPYEWHKSGLSEDGAINLEAPRKWRLLRERTGHGALYGMRMIIYGDCIAPPLDTLKRVVKAGDGAILATSPPYSRFLESGVDFAVVSAGMPRVDMWVQEFLRHEIPCVVADYLVEYVCKPGYSLERHVQYNTHAWAERSLKKLVNRLEEIVEDTMPQKDHRDIDVACQVCSSRDRGEVMLICGDESGSTGCGEGTHIDCCDPPLEDVPVEDWYCSKCSKGKKSKNPQKSTKKENSVAKRK